MAEQYTRRGQRFAPPEAHVEHADGCSLGPPLLAVAASDFASRAERSYIKGEVLGQQVREQRVAWRERWAKLLRAASMAMSLVGRKHE